VNWFPPERGPVVVLGNAGNLFPRHLAGLWRSLGVDARIVTRRWGGERMLADGTPVHVATDSEKPWQRTTYAAIERAAACIEAPIVALQHRRFDAAMGSERSYRPAISPAVADAASIARAVRRLKPQFVCGQEVFSYGLATAWCAGCPRLLMPWGGDVYMYADTTTLASAMVGYALTHVDLVVPGSPLAADHLHRRFGVDPDRMHCGGLWALDRERFVRADSEQRTRICAARGIDPDALIVMNVRRFFPAWGSDIALNVFMDFAAEHAASHFVMLGGSGTEPFVADARATIASRGLTPRFTLYDGDLALGDVAALMSVADIFVSFMRALDMRPLASILEAAACGGAPVLGDQPEYRQMEQAGFEASLCPPENVPAGVAALRRYAASAPLRHEVARRNRAYLDLHEDGRRQAFDLLQRVRTICDTYGR
jgi:glycosyltransferase involved in cell wall biosynthesis